MSPLLSLLTQRLRWETTTQANHYRCTDASGNAHLVTPTDLRRLDDRLIPALSWYAMNVGPEQLNPLLEKTLRFWVAPFHLPWPSSGINSPFSYLDSVAAVTACDYRSRYLRLRGAGVGVRHRNGVQLVVEYASGEMVYRFATLERTLPSGEEKVKRATTGNYSVEQLHRHLFQETLSRKPIREAHSDVALAYAGVLF